MCLGHLERGEVGVGIGASVVVVAVAADSNPSIPYSIADIDTSPAGMYSVDRTVTMEGRRWGMPL
jgi:hypothetical protein